jgi:hypothetical protein
MPAPSKAMRQAAAIALHHPEKLYKRNRSLREMTDEQLHDYASTPEKGLPDHSRDIPLAEMMRGRRSKKKNKRK